MTRNTISSTHHPKAKSVLKCLLYYRFCRQPALLVIGKPLYYEVFKVRIAHYFILFHSLRYLILITAGLIPSYRHCSNKQWV